MSSATEIINELLFVAIAQPDLFEVNISYRSKLDLLSVYVLPATFRLAEADAEEYKEALLISKDITLYQPDALHELVIVRDELLKLLAGEDRQRAQI